MNDEAWSLAKFRADYHWTNSDMHCLHYLSFFGWWVKNNTCKFSFLWIKFLPVSYTPLWIGAKLGVVILARPVCATYNGFLQDIVQVTKQYKISYERVEPPTNTAHILPSYLIPHPYTSPSHNSYSNTYKHSGRKGWYHGIEGTGMLLVHCSHLSSTLGPY